MDNQTTVSTNAQATESTDHKSGRCRVKPRQLSQILRQVIIDRFDAYHSTEEIAEELRIPVRTVSDVVLHDTRRKQPGTAPASARPVLMRRAG
jgi:DNA-directed RNA polymerase specialized sigma24 family protein